VDGVGSSIIGWSQSGWPLTVYQMGTGRLRLFIMGAQHGGPEANTSVLTAMLIEHFGYNQHTIPSNVTMYFMPEANPDGLAMGSRQYVSGVDPNRNWPTADWWPDAYDSNGRLREGLGGPAPFSEQESIAVGNWLWDKWPTFTINYHSVGGFLLGGGPGLGGELAQIMQWTAGYGGSGGGGGGGGGRLGYRATGNMNGWQRGVGMASCIIELGSTWDLEFDRNLAGIKAVLERMRQEG
jgi:hypothetical protein